jgi:putative ABC transport system substrate-binding protein
MRREATGNSKRRSINSKIFSCVLATVLLATVSIVEAQQMKVPRIGYLVPTSSSPYIEAFRQGLRDLGYIEGKNILIEYRYAEGKPDRYPSLVAELVQLKVDILFTSSPGMIRAAKHLTKTIPIVMVSTVDPVAAGYVDSFARPGGNITGLSRLTQELSGKRLELLKEVIPTLSSVGILEVVTTGPVMSKQYEPAARALNIQLRSLQVRSPNPDIDGAFRVASKGPTSALITVRNPVLIPHSNRIVDLAMKNRLPSMYETSDSVEAGGLLSYSSNDVENFRRAASYVDKILKGAKPADIPVEQPTKFELVINLKTAKQIGLTIPNSVLAKTDRVIK